VNSSPIIRTEPIPILKSPKRTPGDESIVPETETQSSTESQQQPILPTVSPTQAGNTDGDIQTNFADVNTSPPAESVAAYASQPAKKSVKSGMKRKLSRNQSSLQSSFTIPKPPQRSLGPLPQVSPSKFLPHLPTSSIQNDEVVNLDDQDLDYPLSSIEQFSSPLKPTNDEANGRKEVRNGDIRNGDIRKRGEELAAIAAANRLQEEGRQKVEKRKLEEVLSEGMSPRMETSSQTGEDDIIAQEMEEAYVDLSGGEGIADTQEETQGHLPQGMTEDMIVALREEVEESSQDLSTEGKANEEYVGDEYDEDADVQSIHEDLMAEEDIQVRL
jgi:hypothetical protein